MSETKSRLAPRGTNIPGLWKPCPGINETCENYVMCPHWVCLRCWQKFCISHGDKLDKKFLVSEELL